MWLHIWMRSADDVVWCGVVGRNVYVSREMGETSAGGM